MSRKSLFALILVGLTLCSVPLAAQEPAGEAGPAAPAGGEGEKVFKLSRGVTSAEEELALQEEIEEIWEPQINKGTVDVSFAIGFLNLKKTLWEHDQIIYKYTTDATFWGDVKITGDSAFNPALRIGYNLTEWFALEAIGGISFTEYSSEITNTRTRENKPNAPVFPDPELGEFDAEQRSLITMQAGVNAVLYPFNLAGDAKGRFHPYVTAGGGRMWYNLNSNFMDETASTSDVNFGGGIRLLADRNISVRFEVVFHKNEVQFIPSGDFLVLNEGTTRIPVNEYPIQADGSFIERPVAEYSTQSLTMMNWSIGVHGAF